MTEQTFLDDDLLKKLERLEVVSRNISILQYESGYKGTRRGGEVEFSDYKPYTPGDDLRYVDWNVFGRLDAFVTKQFTAEEKRNTNIILDTSASMDYGNKFTFSRKLAGAVAAAALFSGDTVDIASIGESVYSFSGEKNDRKEIFNLFRFLKGLSCRGKTVCSKALREFSFHKRAPSRVLFISDLWSDESPQQYLNILAGAETETSVIQVLSREELNPSYRGRCRFVDSETGETVEVDVSREEHTRFIREIESRLDAAERVCLANGMDYILLLDSVPLEKALFELLREKGILQHSSV